jgi:outer membrane protein OmpA-like peptidoglycan-associated protein
MVMRNKWLIGAMSLVLISGAAQAKEPLEKEHKAGMLTGAAMGAVAGGPVGAVFGMVAGALSGDLLSGKRIAEEQALALEQEKQTLEARLQETQQALLALNSVQDTQQDPLIGALAERLHGEVLFRTGSSVLDEPTQQRLADLGTVLAEQSLVVIELEGFADPRGKKDINLQLSEARAAAVREALMKGGLDPERIQLTAHGESKSTALPGDDEAYAWERRVSVAIRATQDSKVANR